MPLALPAAWIDQFLAGRFQVRRLLGAGCMGFVYLARDKDSDAEVVLKVPRPEILLDVVAEGRFVRENAARPEGRAYTAARKGPSMGLG